MSKLGKQLLIAFATLVAFSAQSYSQTGCQGQACAFNGVTQCFICSSGDGFGCSVNSCDSCTTSRCKPRGGGVGGILCQLPEHLKPVKDPLVDLFKPVRFSIQSPGNRDTTSITSLAMVPQENAPASIVSATFTRTAVLKAGELLNSSRKNIVAYQIGWIVGGSPENLRVSTGPVFEVPEKIHPGAMKDIPQQPVPASLLNRRVKVAFFVVRVKFDDGTQWHENIAKLKKKVIDLTPRTDTAPAPVVQN